MIIELKDENNKTNCEAVVLATYLNCEPTVLHETLWIQSELQQQQNIIIICGESYLISTRKGVNLMISVLIAATRIKTDRSVDSASLGFYFLLTRPQMPSRKLRGIMSIVVHVDLYDFEPANEKQ